MQCSLDTHLKEPLFGSKHYCPYPHSIRDLYTHLKHYWGSTSECDLREVLETSRGRWELQNVLIEWKIIVSLGPLMYNYHGWMFHILDTYTSLHTGWATSQSRTFEHVEQSWTGYCHVTY